MDVNQRVPFTVKHQAEASLVARVYRPQFFYDQLTQGKIVVEFDVNDFRSFADQAGIPEWRLRQAAREAAINLVGKIVGLEWSQLVSNSYDDGAGTVSVKPGKGFAFPKMEAD